MKSVRVHFEAEQELLEHEAWYRQRSEVAAQGFLLELEHAIAAVRESPERWPVGRRGEHRYVFPRYPFILLYRIGSNEIFVTAVAHQSRRPGYWHQRT
jgi:plasmid stabilization system protein ParE